MQTGPLENTNKTAVYTLEGSDALLNLEIILFQLSTTFRKKFYKAGVRLAPYPFSAEGLHAS